MKKIKVIVILLFCCLFITACGSNDLEQNSTEANGSSSSTEKRETTQDEKIENNKNGHKHCERLANGEDGAEVDLQYDLYYKGEILNSLKSVEKVTSDKEEVLTKYENAYRSIHAHYKGLKYYNAKIEKTDNSVASVIIIDYDRIDTDILLKIEGEENNVIENGKAKVKKWLELSEKFGTKCTEVND